MRKLLLTASLCVAAVVLVPVASASAAKFAGSCTITGKAKFYSGSVGGTAFHLPKKGIATEKFYKFESEALGTTCTGASVEGTTVTKVLPTDTIVAEVEGEAELGCETSAGVKGKGKIEDATIGATASFTTFAFKGVGTEVQFTIGEPVPASVTATGQASFVADIPGVTACFGTGQGPSELKFAAVTAGAIG